jgi:RNA 2',3'-cyclic 3'-phosphodiesterase
MQAIPSKEIAPQPSGPEPELYVWLAPDAAAQAAIDAHRRQWLWPQGSHQPKPHRLHLTLCLLGTRTDAEIEAIGKALAGVRAGSFELVLDWSGVWSRHGVAVVCPAVHPVLMRLHRAIDRAMSPWARPAAWKPHVTIARRAQGADAPPMAPLRWQVREFLFVRSWLPPHPARHEVLGRYPLG